MPKSTMGLWSRFVLTIVLIVAVNQAHGEALVTINFKGAGFSGSVAYDDSQGGVQQGSNFVFKFENEGVTHALVYNIGAGTSSGINPFCEPFTITTSGTTFTVTAKVPQSPATAVTVVLHTNVSVSSTVLPDCEAGSTPVFQQTGTFKLANYTTGAVSFSGNITSTSCSQRSVAVQPLSDPCEVYYTYAAPCPVYACPPRQGCCLTRLFARRLHRNCCW
jgi:hypothetical protein